MFSVASRESFDHVATWVADARNLARSDTSIVLVANKCDLKDKREVTFLEASRFAQEHDILFVETSALTGEGVDDVFMKLAKAVTNRVEDGAVDSAAVTSGSTLSSRGSGSLGNDERKGSCAC